MENEQIAMNMLDQGMEINSKMADFITALLKIANQSNRYNDATANGVKAILKEIQEGRKPKTDIVDAKDEEVFRQLLDIYHVPYMAISFTDANTGKQRVAFMTREYDKRALDEIRERFLYEMNMGCSEIGVDSFMRNNDGQDVRSYTNLDDAELEVFRQYASRENASFSVIKDAKHHGKHEVLFIMRDKSAIDNAILQMTYDFSGERGKEYKQQVMDGISRKKKFERQLQPEGKETVFVVDTQNPKNFISVNKNGFIIHSLEETEQVRYDGRKENIVLDKNTVSFSAYDKDKLMDYVGKLKNPVVLKADEMSIIASISNTGEAILPAYNEFKKKYDVLKKNLSNRTDFYNNRVVKERLKGPEKVHTLINIPQSVQNVMVQVIRNNHLHETVVSGGCIAYSEKERPVVERAVNAELYQGMNPLQRYEAKIFYEGRGMLNVKDESRTQYVLNANSPEYVMKISDDGLTIFNNGKETGHINRDESFEQTITDLLYTIENPVVLQKGEMEVDPERKIENIMKHLPSNQQNKATEYLQDIERHEKEEICGMSRGESRENLSDRQQEAITKVSVYELQEYHVSRNLLEKIQDHQLGPKTVRETHVYEQEISH